MLRNAKFLLTITRNYSRLPTKNLGMKHRVKAAGTDREGIQMLEEDPEFDPESDFLNSDESHRMHEAEMKLYKEKISKWVVRDKYFKQTSPNFLTWAEKEHIRYLHEENPDEWTVEHLCDSFPIDIHHISKLLKNKWTPKTEKRVESHDAAVKENWEKFRKGEFKKILPPKLVLHLLKFKDREVNLKALPKFEPKKRLTETIQNNNDEFLSIITSCKKYQEIESPKEEPEVPEVQPKRIPSRMNLPVFMKEEDKDGKLDNRMTLDELKILLGDQDEPIKIPETQIETLPENPAGTGIMKHTQKMLSIESDIDFPKKYAVSVTKKDLEAMKVDPIKNHIKIPRKLWKRNATYKYKDCFYDDDGELLYRVPGLTK